MIETFIQEHVLALSNSINISTSNSYGSALNSWLAFISMHQFPIEPTPDSLSFFIIYMSHHIHPKSVKSYLSGLVQQLEPDYPSVRQVCANRLAVKVMKGCMKMRGQTIGRKLPLSIQDLRFIVNKFLPSKSHDDLLFAAILSTGFHGLLRLGELTFPDSSYLQDWQKVTKRSSLITHPHQYEFLLPAHKADRFFEGTRSLLLHLIIPLTPVLFFTVFFLLVIIYFLLHLPYG